MLIMILKKEKTENNMHIGKHCGYKLTNQYNNELQRRANLFWQPETYIKHLSITLEEFNSRQKFSLASSKSNTECIEKQFKFIY